MTTRTLTGRDRDLIISALLVYAQQQRTAADAYTTQGRQQAADYTTAQADHCLRIITLLEDMEDPA